MRVLQVDRVTRVGADLHQGVGVGFQLHAIALDTATPIGRLDKIVFESFQSDSPLGVIGGDVQRA